MRISDWSSDVCSSDRLQHGETVGGEQPLAHRNAHGAAHEGEVEYRDDGRLAAHLAVRHHDGLVGPILGLRLAQAVGVALAVTDLQRIERHRRQFDHIALAVVEQRPEAAQGCAATMQATKRATTKAALTTRVSEPRAMTRTR